MNIPAGVIFMDSIAIMEGDDTPFAKYWKILKPVILAKCSDDVPDTMQYQCVNCCETFRKLSHAKGHAENCQ